MSILLAVVVFGMVVLVHELGHFIAARRCGIWVEEFAIGMGPKLFGITRNDTLYSIRLFPLGGFCLLHSDDADAMSKKNKEVVESEELEPEEEKPVIYPEKAFSGKSVPQRMFVMVAGSGMNFILAFILFSLVAGLSGIRIPTISNVLEGSPAEAAGLLPNDSINTLNGNRIFLWDSIAFETSTGYGRPIDIGFIRDGVQHNLVITPVMMENNRYAIGILPTLRVGLLSDLEEGLYRVTAGEVFTEGFMRIGFVIRMVGTTLLRLVTAPATVVDQIAGPIGIGNMIHGQYQATVTAVEYVDGGFGILVISLILTMANFGALISANIGVMNLLPLPALDGGRLLFLSVEAIRRRPITPERENVVHFAGFVILIVLAGVIAYRDILNLFL